jgi:putative transposase
VLIYKGFRYRIYPTPAQETRLVAWENALRFLWNLANEHRLLGMSMSKKRYPTAFDQINTLKELRAELPWLADVPRDVAAQLLIELDQAWQRCFKRLAWAPRWKRKGQDFLGLTEAHPKSWRLNGSVLQFPKLGNLHAITHRPLEGKPKTCTLKRDGDQWFASIMCEITFPDPVPRTAPVVAIDRGITYTLANSDGKLTPNPKFYEHTMKRFAHAQRIVSRRKKGSKNREKAKLRVMRLHRKVRRQREHFLHVESSRLAKNHGVVVIEKLNVAGMIRSQLGRSIVDAGWSRFAVMLRYKLEWSGGTLVEVPAQYSSQTCSTCGHVDARSRRGERFCCTSCGYVDHADLNAAKVLKTRANRSGLPGEGTVPETARRTRKAKMTLRVPRRSYRETAPIGKVDYRNRRPYLLGNAR